jgi:addiction module RelB/DinJ family antitoxin
MAVIERNRQINFKTNSDILEKAKRVFSKQNLDMTTAFNLFLENVAFTETIPFEVAEDIDREQLIFELRAGIQKSIDDFNKGNYYTSEQVREHFGI